MAYKLRKQYRLYGYDYSLNGAYFITAITKNRICFFGKIENGIMNYNSIGRYVIENIEAVQERKKDLVINEWEVMPNHIHFILTINSNQEGCTFPTGLQPLGKQSISAFMNHFKGRVKKWCDDNGAGGFEWQARFHDHIIRNEKEYLQISSYIQNNIANWNEDQEFSVD